MGNALLSKFLKFSYGSWLGLGIGLFTTLLATRLLQPEALGKASMYDLFIQVCMILTIFGTDQAFVRFFYEEQPEKRGALLYNTLKIPLITSLIMICLVLVLYKPITIYLFENQSIKFALFIVFGVFAQLILRYAQLAIRMQQKGNLYSILQIIQKLVNLGSLLLLFYILGNKFEVLIYSKVFAMVLVIIVAIYCGREMWSLKNLKVKDYKHSQNEIVKFGYPFVLTIFISWLFEAFDKIALRQWSTYEELGLYSAAMRLVALVMVLRATFSTFWTPVAYERFEKRPEDKNFFRYISIVVSFLMFFVAIITIASKDLIIFLLGQDYSKAATIMPFLVFMPIFYTISETTVIGINFYNKVKWHILIATVACVSNILGNWLLVPNFGAIGASVSTAFSYVIFFTLRTLISLKFYRVKYPLVRIYIMSVTIFLYSFVSIIINSFWINILLGLGPLLLLIWLFYKDILFVIKEKSVLFN